MDERFAGRTRPEYTFIFEHRCIAKDYGGDDTLTAIGIDIGGTKISVAAVSADGHIVSESRFPTEPHLGFDLAVERVHEAIARVLDQACWNPRSIAGIGIGCTGPVDPREGIVLNPYTLPSWDGCNLVKPLVDRYAVPVRMENDADAAAMAEWKFGAGRDTTPMVMLTFGTGIGFAMISGGRIYRGVAGAHPEFGHIATSIDGPECYCGQPGCFESLASGAAMDRAGSAAGIGDARSVFKSAAAGDATAISIVQRVLDATASATWTLAHSFAPQQIVLGGGMMEDHFHLFAQVMNATLSRVLMMPGHEIQVVKAALGASAGVIGAASLVI